MSVSNELSQIHQNLLNKSTIFNIKKVVAHSILVILTFNNIFILPLQQRFHLFDNYY